MAWTISVPGHNNWDIITTEFGTITNPFSVRYTHPGGKFPPALEDWNSPEDSVYDDLGNLK